MKNISLLSRLRESVSFVRKRSPLRPNIGVILGSGLGDVVGQLESVADLHSGDIPHFPVSSVQGHAGRVVLGRLGSIPLLAFRGRIHFYECGSLAEVLYPIQFARAMGVSTLILTNAAGGINPAFTPGTLMAIRDHINLTFANPVPPGEETSILPVYDAALLNAMLAAAAAISVPLATGIYCGVQGPSYETAAEVAMCRIAGGDAVGMSTVNEASLAHAIGMKVGGISCITNFATGIGTSRLHHQEVTDVAEKVKSVFSALLLELIRRLAKTRT